jgi:hypothetical protein
MNRTFPAPRVIAVALVVALTQIGAPARTSEGETSVMTRNLYLVGNDPDDRTPSGLRPSDHAGVVARLRFGQ